jgi:hypothetical protein
MHYNDGSQHSGKWFRGQKHGEGKTVDWDGEVMFEGCWNEGQL